ncbi:hypothetical protein Q5752_006742 [Cryptotrichosporon argae]
MSAPLDQPDNSARSDQTSQSQPPAPAQAQPRIPATLCDWCRSRKVKCTPLEGERAEFARRMQLEPTCQRCFRNKQPCRFTYVLKKSGRPRGRSRVTPPLAASTSSSHALPTFDEFKPDESFDWGSVSDLVSTSPYNPLSGDPATGVPTGMVTPGPDLSTFFGSAKGALSAGASRDSDTGLWNSLLTRLLQTPASSPPPLSAFPPVVPTGGQTDSRAQTSTPLHMSAPRPGGMADLSGAWPSLATYSSYPSHNSPLAPGPSPSSIPAGSILGRGLTPAPPSEHVAGSTRGSQTLNGLAASNPTRPLRGQSKSVSRPEFAPWGDVSFFVSLFIKHQHALVPLVHRPTFAGDMLHRRDERDNAFRGLLASIGTICQVPVNHMMGRYERDDLENMLKAARQESRAVQLENAKTPSLTLLISVILDAISSQASGDAILTDQLLAEGRRLIYAMKLHSAAAHADLSVKESQISRILFWEYWAVEKTAALDGKAIMLHTMEGVPPLPLDVDDDLLPSDGSAIQARAGPSCMSGFIAVTRIHRILGDCICHQRCALNRSDDDEPIDVAAALRWLDKALDTLHEILMSLPLVPSTDDELYALGEDDPQRWLGTQVANIRITALSAEFALLDYKAILLPGRDFQAERQATAKHAFETLSSMPVECLASNGESMRGKVLRIIMSLLGATFESDLGEHVWEWWNMYSKFQFLQVIPQLVEGQT